MSNETEEQKQTGILEHPEEKERRLTPESEKVIRDYVFKCLTPTGIVLLVISFLVGFLIHSVAFQSASNQALLSAQSEIIKLIREVMTAKSEVDNAVKSVQVSSTEITKTEEKAKKFADELSSLRAKLDSTVAFQASDPKIKEIADVLAQDPRITSILDELDKSIQIRLKRADEEIEKIKTAYKLDCKEGKAKSLWHFKEVFIFSFPVKHAFIQSIDNLEEPSYRLVFSINDNRVTVTAEPSKPGAMPRKELQRLMKPFVYRVWATSF